ncbi:murein hydrolase activator EnvC family protein [Paenibacillus sp. 481]|uniref:murein hydrolase activator EnvC family protein n=1 Tax=Paenibacillus sp. 481 TaxID=2835869 RepID=UPI001E4CF1BA|nr:M23 family metallopeptidase [Paenibacillus sp. 481]UHA75735.1 peptidoglycan DD-metalloendopeptidase family protein [Paenibacillus sp. 481]
MQQQHNKWKRKYAGLLVSFAILFTMAPPSAGAASELDKVNKQIKQIQRERWAAEKKKQASEQQVAQAEKQIIKTEADLQYVNNLINSETKKMYELSGQIDDTEYKLEEAALEVEELNSRIKSREKLLDSRVSLMYTNGFVSYLDVLFNATSFSDFLDRIDSLQLIVSQDKEILEVQRQEKQLSAAKKQEIEVDLKHLELLYTKRDKTKRELMIKQKEKKVMIAGYQEQKESAHGASEEQDRMLMDFAKKRAELYDKKNRLIEKSRKAKAIAGANTKKSTRYTYTGGKLGMPLQSKHYISSGFGGRRDPISGRRGAFHGGLDMAAPRGTAIHAAENGVVTVAGWQGGFGNTVIINHGNNLWTLYAHIDRGGILVSEGQEVKRGQQIAKVGTTGYSTGYHLHFEVRVNGERVDPANYLK